MRDTGQYFIYNNHIHKKCIIFKWPIKKIHTQLFIGKKGAEKMGNTELDQLRQRVEEINLQLLSLINERASAVQEIGRVKESQGVNRYDPVRERHMLDLIKENNNGPFDDATLLHLFKQIFKAGLESTRRGP